MIIAIFVILIILSSLIAIIPMLHFLITEIKRGTFSRDLEIFVPLFLRGMFSIAILIAGQYMEICVLNYISFAISIIILISAVSHIKFWIYEVKTDRNYRKNNEDKN